MLAEMGFQVVAIKRIPELSASCVAGIGRCPHQKCSRIIIGDGTIGYAEYAPYTGIIVTAVGPRIPDVLKVSLQKWEGW